MYAIFNGQTVLQTVAFFWDWIVHPECASLMVCVAELYFVSYFQWANCFTNGRIFLGLDCSFNRASVMVCVAELYFVCYFYWTHCFTNGHIFLGLPLPILVSNCASDLGLMQMCPKVAIIVLIPDFPNICFPTPASRLLTHIQTHR